MKKAGLRIALLIFVLATVLGILPQSTSAAYENTHKNTGNYRQDIIAVAWTQVGYRAADGKNNNKYSSDFGWDNVAWCGYFVSWCAKQANVPTSVLKRTGWASPSAFGLTALSGDSYTPVAGDLYFMVENGSIIHVGLVVEVNAAKGKVVTVEGNTKDSSGIYGVYRKERNIKGSIFGSPNYGDGGSGHTHTYGELNYESAHPHKAYKACSGCGDKSYTGETRVVDGCQSCCKHTYGDWSSTGSSKHQHICSKCGYTESKSHSWGNDNVIKTATCKDAGSKKQTCAVCGTTRTTEIAKLTTHTFGPWESLDEKTHQRICSVCSKKESKDHIAGEDWLSDAELHWHNCVDCNAVLDQESHSEREYCDSPCEICQFVNPEGHVFGQTPSWDDTNHFLLCTLCPAQSEIMPHEIGTELEAVHQEHYYPCSGCGYHADPKPHTLSAPPTEDAAQTCLECGLEYAPKLIHIHFYRPMEADWEAHWGVCDCGHTYEREAHSFSSATGLCRVCTYPPLEKPEVSALEWMTEKATAVWDFVEEKTTTAWSFMTAEENRLYLYMACGGLVLLLGGITTTVIVVKKKKKVKEPVA